jgi:hypothetical protein
MLECDLMTDDSQTKGRVPFVTVVSDGTAKPDEMVAFDGAV